MSIEFNNFGGSYRTSGIDSAKGKKNDGGSSGGTGYMRQRKKQQDDVQEDFDINGSIFAGEGGMGFHLPSDEELEKMLNSQNEKSINSSIQDKPQHSQNKNIEMQDHKENDKSTTNFFNEYVHKEDGNFFK